MKTFLKHNNSITLETIKLIAAICYIQKHIIAKDEKVLMIEFEDGSGNKFNYRSTHERGDKFIDLTGKI